MILYGIQNVAFHAAANPQPRYFITRAVRDKALAALRDLAVERGLAKSASIAGIYPVKRTVRADATLHEALIEAARENEIEALSEEAA
jgi:hypothetical protein